MATRLTTPIERIDTIDKKLADAEALIEGMRQCRRQFDLFDQLTQARSELRALRTHLIATRHRPSDFREVERP